MKAVMKVDTGVGHVELRDIPAPEPGPGQVLIRVKAAGICGTDLHIYHDEFKTVPPVVLGHEVAGEIAALGPGVSGLAEGMRVTTETYFSTCGSCRYCRDGRTNLCLARKSIGSAVNGGFTQYVVVPAANIHALPETVDFEAGALTEPLACVVHGVLNMRTVAAGDLAVIAGPGAIGLLTLQVVKASGATVVMLGTDADSHRLALASELGADYTLNVQQEDPTDLIAEISEEGLGADVVYECSGAGPAAQQLAAVGAPPGPLRPDRSVRQADRLGSGPGLLQGTRRHRQQCQRAVVVEQSPTFDGQRRGVDQTAHHPPLSRNRLVGSLCRLREQAGREDVVDAGGISGAGEGAWLTKWDGHT